MKSIRFMLCVLTSTILALLAVLTVTELVEFAGLMAAIQFVYEDPSVLHDAFLDGLASVQLTYDWFGHYGPTALVTLLFLLLIASLP